MNLSKFLRLFSHLLLIVLLTLSAGFAVSCSSSDASEEEDTESSESSDEEESDDEEDEEAEDEEEGEESEDKDDSSEKESKKDDAKEKEKDPSDHDKDKKSHEKPEKKGHDSDPKEDKKKSAKKSQKTKKSANAGNITLLWEKMLEGNARFVAGKHTTGKYIASRKSLTKGQSPDVIVISCSDSRVPPELVFDKNLGELFVIRTAGNVADPIALGSIEYAAEHLNSRMLVVLGHETCGAVGATLTGERMPTRNLNAITNAIRKSFKGEKDCRSDGKGGNKCIKLNVSNSARSMVARSPILKKLVGDGSLHVVKAIYEMESGKVVRF